MTGVQTCALPILGKHHAARFDSVHWRYFTEEFYDLLYPAYGDTWGMFNGAIGLTYEVGGIGAGISLRRSQSDTLSLKKKELPSTLQPVFQPLRSLFRTETNFCGNLMLIFPIPTRVLHRHIKVI